MGERLPKVGEVWPIAATKSGRAWSAEIKLVEDGFVWVLRKLPDGTAVPDGWMLGDFMRSFVPPPEPWEGVEPWEAEAFIKPSGEMFVCVNAIAPLTPTERQCPHGRVLITVLPETWTRGDV